MILFSLGTSSDRGQTFFCPLPMGCPNRARPSPFCPPILPRCPISLTSARSRSFRPNSPLFLPKSPTRPRFAQVARSCPSLVDVLSLWVGLAQDGVESGGMAKRGQKLCCLFISSSSYLNWPLVHSLTYQLIKAGYSNSCYLDWRFLTRPNRSTWPAEYCSMTSLTS